MTSAEANERRRTRAAMPGRIDGARDGWNGAGTPRGGRTVAGRAVGGRPAMKLRIELHDAIDNRLIGRGRASIIGRAAVDPRRPARPRTSS